ncbi:hypothetical protein QTP86_032540, partial [Hemibagrus guttatus]
RPMPVAFTRGPYKGPSLEKLEAVTWKSHHTKWSPETTCTSVFKRKHWKEPQCEGPFKVVLTTPTAVKVEGKEYWYHLNHCCRAAGKDLKEKSPEPKETKSKLNADLDDSDSENTEQSTG